MKGKQFLKNRIVLISLAIVGGLLVPLTASLSEKAHYKPPSNQLIAKLLRWIPAPISPCRLCGGYFLQPTAIQSHPAPPDYKKLPTRISAKGPALFSIKEGLSTLQNQVHITQTGRLITADKATLYRNKQTGKITYVHLKGHVNLEEYGKEIISQSARFNLEQQTGTLTRVLYRILQSRCDTYSGSIDGWGTAERAHRQANGIVSLDNATYSTCSPLHPNWQISAKQITIDRDKNRGTAKDVVLRIKNVPVFYSPYLSFSIDKARQSGFLTPVLSSSSDNGFAIGLPYYWNIAPNFDLMVTPIYYSKNSLQLNGLFRYLTKGSVGSIEVSAVPSDPAFNQFKNDTIASYPPPVSPELQPYINQLKKDSDSRAYFAFYDRSKLGTNWSLETILHYVTDAYYFRDFGVTVNAINSNQLLNRFDLQYQGTHWQAALIAQTYQTLHLIDQATDPTINQYMRLPELDALASYPDLFPGLNLDLSLQAVNFAYQSDFPPVSSELPIGQRFHIQPTLSYPIVKPAGYITPSLIFDSTTYNISQPNPGQATQSTRNLPIFDIDSGLYLDRNFQWGQHQYIQTLEPRLFYLYTPFLNQDKYPVFDTQELPFTFEQLFSINRFSGIDRLQNANQISIGLTSKVFDQDSAFQRLKADIGMGYYITPPEVCLTSNCPTNNRHFTPIASKLTYYPRYHWAISGALAWDPVLRQINNTQIEGNYNLNGRYIVGGGYAFVHENATTSPDYVTDNTNNEGSSITEFHLAWPLSYHWSTLGYIYYNLTQHRPESYFVGFQYDTCCLSFRFIVNRLYLGSTPNSSATNSTDRFSTNYIIQLQLKGLGSAGNSNPHNLLTSAIPGFDDPFL